MKTTIQELVDMCKEQFDKHYEKDGWYHTVMCTLWAAAILTLDALSLVGFVLCGAFILIMFGNWLYKKK